MITQADVDAGEVINTATVTGDDPDGAPVSDVSDSSNPGDDTGARMTRPRQCFRRTLRLNLIKETSSIDDTVVDGVTGGVGDTINYAFTVTNTGDVTLTDVTLIDDTAVVAGGPILTMAPGEVDSTTFTATYVITQADIDAGEVVNTATVTGDDPDGNPVSDVSDSANPGDDTGGPDDPTTTVVPQNPLIELIKSTSSIDDTVVDGVTGGVGDTINYAFTVTNVGDVTLTDVTLSDDTAAVVGGPIVTLAPGEADSTTFTASYVITQADVDAGEVINTATVTGEDPDGTPVTDVSDSANPGDDTGGPDDPTTTTLGQNPFIELIKSTSSIDDTVVDGVTGGIGDTINYSFRVTNTGDVTLTDVTLSDDTAVVAGGPILSLAPGEIDLLTFSASYIITQADVDAGEVINTATVTGDDPDDNPVSDVSDSANPGDDTGGPDDPTTTTLGQNPFIELIKSTSSIDDTVVDGVTSGVGDTINYAFTVTNTGDVTLTDVTLTDDTAIVAGGPILTLAPGEVDSTTFTASYVITQVDIDAGEVVNTATVSGGDPDGTPVTDVSDSANPGDDTGGPDDPTTTTLGQNPLIELVKSTSSIDDTVVDGVDGGLGDTINYAFSVTNTGDVTLTDVTLTDDTAVVVGGSILTLAPGASDSATFTASYVITQADIDAGEVVNTATVTGDDPDGTPVSDVSDSANPGDDTGGPDDPTVTRLSLADLAIVKTVTGGGTTHVPGASISYDLVVTNEGPITAVNTTVTDTLPADAGFVSATPTTGSCAESGGVITCDLGDLIDGASETITVVATIAADSTTTQTNVAQVSSDVPDPTPGNNVSSVSTSPSPEADLAILKSAAATYVPGEQLTYTLTATNNGPSVPTTGVITDTLPADVTFVALGTSSTCTETAGTVTCTQVGAWPVGTTQDFTIVVATTPDSTGTLINTAAVASELFDPISSNDTSSANSDPVPQANIVVDKTGVAAASAGDQFDFTITVTNEGPSDASSVVLTDVLPAGLGFVSATVSGGAGTETCDVAVACDLGVVVPGATETVTLRVQVGDDVAGLVENTAVATTPTAGDDPADNTSSHPVTISEESDLSISKIDDVDPVEAGALLTYTLTPANAGPSQATTVTITDTLPSEVAFVSADPGCSHDGATTGGVVTCDVAVVAVGSGPVLRITVRTDSSLPDGSSFTNTATISAASDTNPTNNDTTEDTAVVAVTDLLVTKASSAKPFQPGQPLTYTVSVLNAGPSDATSVVLSDPMPAGFSAVSATTDTGATCSIVASLVECSIGSLSAAAGQNQVVITIIGVTDPGATLLENTATVTTATTESDPSNNQATDVNVGEPSADLSVIKTDSADPVAAGSDLTYTIVVSNAGPSDATSVSVVDTLPFGFTVGSVDRIECDTTVSCSFASIPAGQSETIVVTGTVDADLADTGADELVNTVTVSSAVTDPDPTNDTFTEPTDVVESADVFLSKIEDSGGVTPGGQLTYTIQVANAGPSDALSVLVTDTLPVGLTFVSSTDPTCAITGDPQIVECSLGTLGAGDPAISFDVIVDVAPGVFGTVSNTATASSPTPDPDLDNNTDSTITPTTSEADLEITKTDLQDPVLAGTTLTYLLSGQNSGPSDAVNVIVTDPLPAGTTYQGATVTVGAGTCTEIGGVVTCALGTLAPGDLFSIEVSVLVDADVSDGSTLVNTASIGSDTDDSNTANDSDDETTAIIAEADVGVTKLAIIDPASPGASIEYEIRVANFGPSDAVAVSIVDVLPPGLLNAVFIPTAGTCGAVGASTSCDLGDIAVGDEVVVTITADIDPSLLDTLNNVVDVSTVTTDPNPANDQAMTETPVDPSADLAVQKTAASATVVAGTITSYTVVVSNNGPSDALNASIADTLPAGLTFLSASVTAGVGSCAGTTAITCDFPVVAAGTSVSVAIDVSVDADVADGTVIVNDAAVSSDTPDPILDNNLDDASISVVAEADMAITKSLSADPFSPGSPLVYTLVVTNAGPSDAQSVQIVDAVPSELSVTAALTTAGSCAVSAGTVTCDLGVVAVGDAVTITIQTDTDPSTASSVSNTATVSSSTTDPNLPNNSSTIGTNPAPTADLAVTKTVDPSSVVAGEDLTYTISLTNLGVSTASDVELIDVIPAELEYVSHTQTSTLGSCAFEAVGSTVRCTTTTLLPGESLSATIVATVRPDVTAPSVVNPATKSSTTPDSDPTNDQDSATSTVTGEADVAITKSLLTSPFLAGATAEYRLTVSNIGPSTAQNVLVVDSLPTGLSFLGASATQGSCAAAGALVSCNVGSLAVGAAVTVDLTVDVAANVGAEVTNTANVTTTTPDPDPGNNQSSTTDPTERLADLVVTKSTINTSIIPGEGVDYVVTVTNAGPADADSVTVTDALVAALQPTRAVSDAGTCSISGQTITCAEGTIAVGASANITISADLDPDFVGILENAVTAASGTTPDPDLNNNATSVADPVEAIPTADLATVKVGPGTMSGAGELTYTITVTNNGPSAATGVLVRDQLDPAMTFVSATSGCLASAGVVTCSVADLAVGESARVDVVVSVPAVTTPTVLTNVATSSAIEDDPAPANNVSTVDTILASSIASIDGTVWWDVDGDGTIGTDEERLAGVTVTLTGDPDGDGTPDTISVVTAADGTYSSEVAPGTWTVAIDETSVPFGMRATTATSSEVTVAANETATVDFGERWAIVSGEVWLDLNRDGVFDANEPRLDNVTVLASFPGPDGIEGTADDIELSSMGDSSYRFDRVPVGQAGTIMVDRSSIAPDLAATFDIDGLLDDRTIVLVETAIEIVDVNFGYSPPVQPGAPTLSPPTFQYTPPTPTPTPAPVVTPPRPTPDLALTGTRVLGAVAGGLFAILLGGYFAIGARRVRREDDVE